MIVFKLDVSCCPNPGYGPDQAVLELDEAAALRLRANMLFVAENEKRADMSRDEIDYCEFMNASFFEGKGADEMFRESGVRLRCFKDMFCVAFYDDSDGSQLYETETVGLAELEKRMKQKGWL